MPEEVDSLDRRIAAIAGRQHGVVTFRQLRAAGLTGDAVLRRARSGRLHRLHRGVYAVGHRAPSREREWMAAVLASGEGAALSFRSAAAHWGLLLPVDGPVDVSVSSQAGRARRAGIRLHRCRSLGPELVVRRAGIPVTTPARTLTDLKRAVPEWQWRKAVRQAEFKRLNLGSEIEPMGRAATWSRTSCASAGARAFPRQRSMFYDYHRGRIAFQDDHARDLALRRHGLDVRRYSEHQLNERAWEVTADLRAAFAATTGARDPTAPLTDS